MALVLVGVLVLAMWFMAAGTARGSDYWAQALVGWLAGVLRHVPLVGGLAAGQVVKCGRWISNKLGSAAIAIESHIAGFFAGVLTVVKFVAFWTFGWPVEMVMVTKWLLHDEIPKLIKALRAVPGVLVRTVTHTIGLTKHEWAALKALAASAARAAVRVPIGALSHADFGAIKWLRANYRALVAAAAAVGGLALPWAEVPRLRHALDGLWKRIRAQEKRLAGITAAGVIAAALAKLGAGWLRCQKVRKYGPRVCHLDDDWLSSLFLDGALIFGAVSVVTFARELRAVEDEALNVLHTLVREFPKPPAESA